MLLGVIGSRKYPLMDLVRSYPFSLPKDTVIVTGGWPSRAGGYNVVEPSPGVDREIWTHAERAGLVTVLVAGSETKRKHLAGLQRNPVLAEIVHAATAFWDLTSRGTANTLSELYRLQKPVVVVGPDGQPVLDWAHRVFLLLR